MKKLFLLSLLCLGLTASSFADYLDDWPDDALCGWMENPLPPSYMVEEVKTRGISCSGGIPVPPEIVVPCLLEPCDPIEPIVPPIRPGWKILKGTDMWVIDETDPYWQTPEGLIEKPLKIDPGIEYAPETVPGADKKKVPDLPPNHCAPTPGNPCPEGVIETSPMPDPTVPIDQANRPGWKIAEGSNFWSIDEADPYWQTEEGNQRAEARKYQASGLVPAKIDPGIEYAPETVPGADKKKVPDLPPNHCAPTPGNPCP